MEKGKDFCDKEKVIARLKVLLYNCIVLLKEELGLNSSNIQILTGMTNEEYKEIME